jgi:hypothetical protein
VLPQVRVVAVAAHCAPCLSFERERIVRELREMASQADVFETGYVADVLAQAADEIENQPPAEVPQVADDAEVPIS